MEWGKKQMSPFEAIMLFCFGFAWPISMVRSYKSRSTKGKSVLFSFVILTGYASGIVHKIVYSPDVVLALYILNFLMVSADTALWFRNRRLEKQGESPELFVENNVNN